MERMTHKDGDGYYVIDGDQCFEDQCENYFGPAADRLAAYEDTGLLPEEIVKMGMAFEDSKRYSGRLEGKLKSYEEAKQDGRLVILDEPMRPLVWGDKDHDTVLCPQCLHDLMGGFEFAPSSETQMFQCPHCGQPIDATKALTREEAEAALAGERKDGEG